MARTWPLSLVDTTPAKEHRFDLYRIDLNGKNEQVVEQEVRADDPSWSSNGRWILFVGKLRI
ncbi:MAG: hypothetical protein M3198_20155 [Actinomycetota bacterium]|nr:hypothetical protein [Actinomycetota bacterium]